MKQNKNYSVGSKMIFCGLEVIFLKVKKMGNSTVRMSKNSLASGNLFMQFITSTNKGRKSI